MARPPGSELRTADLATAPLDGLDKEAFLSTVRPSKAAGFSFRRDADRELEGATDLT
jgi:hypothetical protein